MLYFNTFIFIFVILISIYLILNFKILSPYDITLLSISTIVLLLATLEVLIPKKKNIEKFASSTDVSTLDIPTILAKYKKMDSEENITEIQTNLNSYLTVFNKTSFNNMGKIWFNISNIKQDGTCHDSDNSKFTFDLSPIFTRTNGIYLGNNRIIGPLSNALNIQFHNTYTIVFACKHGNLQVDNKNEEIELLKLYANSPNNNGITMYIEKGTLDTDNNTQVGTLMFQYANYPPYRCKVDKDHNFINLDKDTLTFYFIIKDTDNVRVLMMAEGASRIYLILKFNISNIDITFSNKELILNRLLNWNSTIYNFAIYDRALIDEQVINFYSHIMAEYIKNLDPNFNTMLTQYNDSIGLIQSLLKCPYDKTVCTNCSSVKSWCDTNQVMNSSSQCRKSINDYCANNTANPLCKCWDTSSVIYNTDNCKLYRSIFSGEKKSSFDVLNPEDLEYIKGKYGLIWPHECPTTITKPKFIENTYNKYDWNKLKVYLDPNDKKTGPDGNEALDKARQDQLKKDDQNYNDSVDWENRKIKEAANPEIIAAAKLVAGNADKNYAVTNYYKDDPNLQETQKILTEAQKEQANLFDSTKGMQIYNQYKKENTNSTVKNIVQPTSQVSDKISDTLPKSDTFFNKFMKVMLPTQQ
jgi:hypothetical protein